MDDRPDPLQGSERSWPSSPYTDQARAGEPPWETCCCIALMGDCTVFCLSSRPTAGIDRAVLRCARGGSIMFL